MNRTLLVPRRYGRKSLTARLVKWVRTQKRILCLFWFYLSMKRPVGEAWRSANSTIK